MMGPRQLRPCEPHERLAGPLGRSEGSLRPGADGHRGAMLAIRTAGMPDSRVARRDEDTHDDDGDTQRLGRGRISWSRQGRDARGRHRLAPPHHPPAQAQVDARLAATLAGPQGHLRREAHRARVPRGDHALGGGRRHLSSVQLRSSGVGPGRRRAQGGDRRAQGQGRRLFRCAEVDSLHVGAGRRPQRLRPRARRHRCRLPEGVRGPRSSRTSSCSPASCTG